MKSYRTGILLKAKLFHKIIKKMNKKIILSLIIIAVVAAIGVGGTVAFFSDTETSTGNTFTTGGIDLGIDNQSYYNGEFNENTSWLLTYDLDDSKGFGLDGKYFYFNFKDLKPGDWGEDTISLHVNNNDAWVCADITLTSNDENDIVEPEADLGDTEPEGELAAEINFIWWADDGDNVLEDGERIFFGSDFNLGDLKVDNTYTITIADSNKNIFEENEEPLNGCDDPATCTYYIGKAWCFGELIPTYDGYGDPTQEPGFTCNGELVTNLSQSDSVTADIGFRAIQSINNKNFTCKD